MIWKPISSPTDCKTHERRAWTTTRTTTRPPNPKANAVKSDASRLIDGLVYRKLQIEGGGEDGELHRDRKRKHLGERGPKAVDS